MQNMSNQKKLIQAIIEQESIYDITVIDNSMLPKKMKSKKLVQFSVKPPSLEVMALCALPLSSIPESVKEVEQVEFKEAAKYVSEMAEVFAILSHGKKKGLPQWYVPFILANVTVKEMFLLFSETALKMQTDFFLSSFPIADQTNPMT